MKDAALRNLSRILDPDDPDPARLESAWESAAGETIVVVAGRTIRAATALYHYDALRPGVRTAVDAWAADRFVGIEPSREPAAPEHDAPETGPSQPDPASSPGDPPGGEKRHRNAPESPSPPAAPVRPSAFESDPFDRFLEWVSSFVRIFQ